MYRTHTCQELRPEHAHQEVVLSGWIHRRRDHGDLIFIDLRDRYGLTQVVFDPSVSVEAHAMAGELRSEFVIQVKAKVVVRPEAQINKNIETGAIEAQALELKILNRALTPPFEIDSNQEPNEELRLKYRYLDLRRERMKKNILFRHRFIKRTRDLMDAESFVEVETPMLMKGTPEGSREFLVPARLYPGTFYVLPQSPQQLKQLLMVGGMDRYFQVARCFRDEDSRGDRQPEFTQLDIEMSFVDEEDVMEVNERVLKSLFKELVPHKRLLADPFPRLTWHEALSQYGSDKPDLRFDMRFTDLSEEFLASDFNVFKKNVEEGGVVKALLVKGQAAWSRKELDDLTELAKIHGLQGLAYIKWTEEGINSPIAKFISEEVMAKITQKTGLEKGDLLLFSSSSDFETACNALGQVRLVCGEKLGLRDPLVLACCWVVDFPLLEWDKDAGRYFAAHHPFTSPKLEHLELLDTDPGKVLAKAYDIAMNGCEIGGGSIRIHSPEIQKKLFEVLGLEEEEIQSRFGHIIEAFRYGAPPHGGIAWGLDRIIMLLLDEPNIREVIAFPKDSKAKDLLSGAPAPMPESAVHEMHIQLLHKE